MSADFDASDGVKPDDGLHAPAAARLQSALTDLLSHLQSLQHKSDERFSLLCQRLTSLERRLSILPAAENDDSAEIDDNSTAAAAKHPSKERIQAESYAAGGNHWQDVIFGLELASNDSLASLRSALVADLQKGACTALTFLGCLLLFRAAEVDRMSPLLKDLGESYYAWCAGRDDSSENEQQALVAWLVRRCAAVGVTNVIELVRVGDRLDLARHSATGRGVDVAAVHGWVVLRDNGKVYTKAAVTAR